ncbi:MAG: endolytic transglycosylase MltG, partial [Gammaproteobacteria bacterium]|nr:endolytic transglycosylase MltG [Gammaproteobacteria bacterium]
LTSGSGLYYRPFTIVPCWSFKQLRDELLKTEELRHLSAHFNDKQIMERLGYPGLSPEGEFYPDTYYYTKGDIDWVILKRAFHLMQSILQQAWQNRSPNLPYKNSYEALIVASMVEKEGYLNSERPVIASVLINRLNKNMLLQIDATVIYGLGSRYNGKIYKTDLLEDTVYNTYVHKGLPPTPIAMPGFVSIQSAMHPQQTDYYYYVAKGDGSHHFSTSLEEHNAAVQAATNKNNSMNDTFIHQRIWLKQPIRLPLLNNLNSTY